MNSKFFKGSWRRCGWSFRILMLALFSLMSSGTVAAQTWDNGGSGSNWTTGNNWNPNGVPANDGSANVNFANGFFFNSSSSTVDVPWNINSLTLTGLLSTHTFSGNALTIQSGVSHTGVISSGVFNNNLVLPNQTIWSTANNATITVNGSISGAGGLTKAGGGSLTLGSGNTYTGTTDLTAGTLIFSGDDVLSDSSSLVLSGGLLQTGGNSDLIGSLTVSGNATIDLGGGASILEFVSSSYVSGTLTIANYNPGSTEVRFSSSPSQSFLDQVYWSSQDITGARYIGAEIVPVPEPGTILGGGMLLICAGIGLWRKRRELRPAQAAA